MGAQKGTSGPVCVEACECVYVCAHAAIIMYTSGIFLEELSPVA